MLVNFDQCPRFERKDKEQKTKEEERKKAIHMEEQRKAWERDRVMSSKDDPYGDPFAEKYGNLLFILGYLCYLLFIFIFCLKCCLVCNN